MGVDDEIEAGFLRPNALPDANQDKISRNVVITYASVAFALNSPAQGPVTSMALT